VRRPYTWESTLIVFLFLLILLGLNLFFGLIQILVSEPLIFSPILIIGELFFLGVVIAWVAFRRLPWQETFYLYKTSWTLVGLGVLLAVTWWPVAVGLGTLMEQLFSLIGPPPEIPMPRNTLDAIGYVIAIVILAPLCEEPIFRGFVMRGWLRYGFVAGVVGSGTLFGLQHAQLAGLIPLSVVGVVLGIVVFRAGSLVPGVVLHAVYNGIAVPFLVVPDLVPEIEDSSFMIAGAIFTPIALFTLWLYHRRSPSQAPAQPASFHQNQIVATLISLVLVLGMFMVIASLEILVRLNPELVGG
jgi:membrane protease YdiL (CAAX protease family)